ncbi:DMT family transporter [Gudongella sp. DL1XJH-153]|uniref:DMT family transporter n=1 Tax=Gudongella sp. DL1XJH-153 TaxID=3409804 RepID=UPI003BB55E96
MTKELRSSLLLLLTAAIWGLAFVAQRIGMDYIGAFTFNAIRFALGSLSLIPVIYFVEGSNRRKGIVEEQGEKDKKKIFKYGLIAGSVLFTAAALQQVGLIYTTAGKAGFITSLYIVLVPILGLFIKQKSNGFIWVGAIVAAIGLYFLSINEDFTIQFGDLLQLIGAFFWATHILVIGHFASKVNTLKLSSAQFATCSVLSLMVALVFEDIQIANIISAAVPILYGGLMSVGVAYTLQVVAQRHAKPSHAAIALSTEAVFAALGGAVLLGEIMSFRGYFGAFLMLVGMLISQGDNIISRNRKKATINE